jgi:hypothetical protein
LSHSVEHGGQNGAANVRVPKGWSLLIATLPISACQDSPPDMTEQARMSRAMDKMEAEQAQSDIARYAAAASAESDAAQNKTATTAQEQQARKN